jgi:hypothetical protein
MKLSPLQTARYQYQPKLPGMLRGGIAEISVKNGEATKSVADQEKIAALFPNTYGKNEITFQKGQNTSEAKKQVVGVSACALGNLQDNGSMLLLASFGNSLNDLHVVDVESADSVAAVVGLLKHLFGSNKSHDMYILS